MRSVLDAIVVQHVDHNSNPPAKGINTLCNKLPLPTAPKHWQRGTLINLILNTAAAKGPKGSGLNPDLQTPNPDIPSARGG